MLVQHAPAMSVIVITPDSYGTVLKTIRRLRAQSAKDQLEIVLVVPSAQGANIDYSDLGSFHGVQIVEIANCGFPCQNLVALATADVCLHRSTHSSHPISSDCP
jgi:hypothetical protein